MSQLEQFKLPHRRKFSLTVVKLTVKPIILQIEGYIASKEGEGAVSQPVTIQIDGAQSTNTLKQDATLKPTSHLKDPTKFTDTNCISTNLHR